VTAPDPIYLDHAATSFPKAPGVTDAVCEFLDAAPGNPGRGGHRLTVEASRRIEGARERVATLLGGDPERTLLGPGCTFWLNTLLAELLGPGDRVITSSLEHNAVMRPLRRLERRLGLEVVVVDGADPDAVPTAAEVARATAAAPTRLVVVTHASNVTGAVLPVEAIARAIAPVPVIADGAQVAGSLPFDFGRSGLAAWTCSGHKGLLGPTGTGVLMLSPELEPEPLVLGGTGSNSESEAMPAWLPDRLESGTPNGAGIAGLGAACEWLAARGIDRIHAHATTLVRRLLDGLDRIRAVRIVGAPGTGTRIGIVSFTLSGHDVGEVAARLDREHGVMLRPGLHCAPAAHRRLGTFPDGTLRVGIGPFTDAAHVDALVEGVAAIASPPSSST
jgi:cysteine desulfurase family protein